MLKKIFYQYVVYLMYFLGVGMVSSGIVLMPFNTVRYSIILSIGLLLFLSGTLFSEFVIQMKHLSVVASMKLIIVTLTLAIGIGMISGGIAHFKESPQFVAYLIPLGIIISFISFTIKNNFTLNKKERLVSYLGVLTFSIITFAFLNWLGQTSNMDKSIGGDIFKSSPHTKSDSMH